MKATHEQVGKLMRTVKSNSLTQAIFGIMKDGTFYTADGIAEMVGYSKRTVSARINDIKHKMGYQVIGSYYTTGLPHIYKYYMPLKDGKPIPCKRKPKPDGLECWACRDDDGLRTIYTIEPTKENGKWRNHDLPCALKVTEREKTVAIFPKGIKPGECKRVVIPRAVVLEDD